MDILSFSKLVLIQEARALLARLAMLKPFILHETMVPAANISPLALSSIEKQISTNRKKLEVMIYSYLKWLEKTDTTPHEAHRKFYLLKLRFNAILAQFDIFSDVMTQRSEHDTGIWLSGLDVLAQEALSLPDYYEAPPVICYLERGIGAAIRRARTRLPGGGQNPVAIVRIPRERMVGSGIASSLVHEVGHQVSALLDLVNSIRPLLLGMQKGSDSLIWQFYDRWISEIIPDMWSVARLGITGTIGLMGVVSLPRAFVFRIALDDPHPFPYLRVKISCAIGETLYPHPQWEKLNKLWEAFYPLSFLDRGRQYLIRRLEEKIPSLLSLLINHRPKKLKGLSMREVLDLESRRPESLIAYYQECKRFPSALKKIPPTVAVAMLGQAKFEGLLSPEDESRILTKLLQEWAVQSTTNISALCAEVQRLKGAISVK